MSTPKRIQRSRRRGWRMPEGAVYVGRPTRWGNPYVGGNPDAPDPGGADRAYVTRLFREYLDRPEQAALRAAVRAELALEDLVTCLNTVEDWVETVPDRPRSQTFWWTWRAAKRCLHQWTHRGIIGAPSHSYCLDLGRAPGGCFVCGSEADLDTLRFGRMTPLFHWSLPVCTTHRGARHPKDPPPDVLITPEIRRWLDRHERVEEAA